MREMLNFDSLRMRDRRCCLELDSLGLRFLCGEGIARLGAAKRGIMSPWSHRLAGGAGKPQ